MTEQREKKPFFVSTGFFVDFLMASIFFLTICSALMVTLCYVQVIKLAYLFQVTPFIMVFVFTLIRRLRIGNLPMIALHAISLIPFTIVFYYLSGRDSAGTVFICVSLILNACYSMFQRYKVEHILVHPDGVAFSIAIHVCIFALFVAFKRTDFLIYIAMNAVLIVTFYFIARQLNVFEERYFHALHSTTQAVDSVRKQNNMTILIIVGCIIFSVLVLLVFPMDVLYSIIRMMLYGIIWLISKLPSMKLPKEDGETANQKLPEDFSDGEGNSTFIKILGYVILAFIAILVFYILVTTIIELFKKFRHPEQIDKVKQDDSVIDIIESIDPKKKKKQENDRLDFGTGYEREIRKKYYNTVRKAMRRGAKVKNSSSPMQIQTLLQKKGDRSIAELTSKYIAVRYNKKTD